MNRTLAAIFVFAVLGAFDAGAQPAVHGWVDGYLAWNRSHPASGLDFFPGTGTSAHRAGRPALNVAALEVTGNVRATGYHVVLVGGDAADVVHAGEPQAGRPWIRNLYQASVSWTAPLGRGVGLEAGVYPSHIGFEGFFSKDNWNYTHGWLAELSPYYQSGVKASYAWSDRWSGQVHLLRGWQLIGDNGVAPALGTQVAYSDSRFSGALNTFAGPEVSRDSSHRRLFADLVATWKATPRLSIGTSLDRGRAAHPARPAANWLGIAVWSRCTFGPRHAVALRTERFRDPDGGISGSAQTLDETTVTYELRPAPHLTLKLEGRRDRSTARVFDDRRSQTLAVAGAVVSF